MPSANLVRIGLVDVTRDLPHPHTHHDRITSTHDSRGVEDPTQAGCGEPRLAPSDPSVSEVWEAATADEGRPGALGVPVQDLARLARRPRSCDAGHRRSMGSNGIQALLEVEEQEKEKRPTACLIGAGGAHPRDLPC